MVQEKEGYANLIAVRGIFDGKSCISRNETHDDTIFAVDNYIIVSICVRFLDNDKKLSFF